MTKAGLIAAAAAVLAWIGSAVLDYMVYGGQSFGATLLMGMSSLRLIERGLLALICGASAAIVIWHMNFRRQVMRALGRLHRELDRANKKVRENADIRSEFLSVASQKLRRPIQVMREFFVLVKDGMTGPLTPDQAACLGVGLRNCDMLSNMFEDFFSLYRFETGGYDLNRKRVEIGRLVPNCARTHLAQCQMHFLRLDVEIPENLPPVLCDPDLIDQVIGKLVDNARAATPAGGSITLAVRPASEESGFVTIMVKDTGSGIPREILRRIYDAFAQVTAQPQNLAPGLGLGLSIARHIVALHGGEITIDTERDAGTDVCFTLPRYTPQFELHSFIEDRRAAMAHKGNYLAAILVSLIPTPDWPSVAGSQSPVECLTEIEASIQETLRRKRDGTLLTQSELSIVVAAEVAEGAEGFLHRRVEDVIAACVGPRIPVYTAAGIVRRDDDIPEALSDLKANLQPLPRRPRRKRVLVVGENDELSDLITITLQSSGLNITVEQTGYSPDGDLAMVRKQPDLIVCDIDSSPVDPEHSLTALKNRARQMPLRAMLVSEHPKSFVQFFGSGIEDCLAVPINVKELVERTARLLHQMDTFIEETQPIRINR